MKFQVNIGQYESIHSSLVQRKWLDETKKNENSWNLEIEKPLSNNDKLYKKFSNFDWKSISYWI